MPTPESQALRRARQSAAVDLQMDPEDLALSWSALGHVLEALEIDLELRRGDLAMAWEAIARAWREETVDLALAPEDIMRVWESVARDLSTMGPEAISLLNTLNAEPLVLKALNGLGVRD